MRRFIWPQAFDYFKAPEDPEAVKEGAKAAESEESSDDEAPDAGQEHGRLAGKQRGCEATRWSE